MKLTGSDSPYLKDSRELDFGYGLAIFAIPKLIAGQSPAVASETCELKKLIAGCSSLVARRAHNPKVAGSNPAPATKFKSRH